jgi:hypothetical protein
VSYGAPRFGQHLGVPIDEKLWVLDKSETFALSGWLTQAETIRREMNRLVFSHWNQIRDEQALSKSVLRRYIGYTNTHRALVDRESIGTHGGTYAEELIASIIRARVARDFQEDIHIHQNLWDKIAKREADVCAMRNDKLLLVIEVKSVLTKEEWRKTRQIKEDYQKLESPPSYWLIAIRADGLDEPLEKALDDDSASCVLSKQGRKIFTLPEQKLEMWKPLENWLDVMMEALKPVSLGEDNRNGAQVFE